MLDCTADAYRIAAYSGHEGHVETSVFQAVEVEDVRIPGVRGLRPALQHDLVAGCIGPPAREWSGLVEPASGEEQITSGSLLERGDYRFGPCQIVSVG